jgi:hypothetical protein
MGGDCNSSIVAAAGRNRVYEALHSIGRKKESGAFIMKVAPRRLEQPKEGD